METLRKRQSDSKQVSAPLLADHFTVHAHVLVFPAGGSNILEGKCSAKQGCIPLGTQVPKQSPSELEAKALKAWLFSDTSLAVTQPSLKHQFPYLKIKGNKAFHLPTHCSTHPTAA